MHYECLTSRQRWLLVPDEEKYMLDVMYNMSVYQLDHFDMVGHLNQATETEIFPSGNIAHRIKQT